MPTLDWIGKKAVLNHHREVPYHLLKCDKELSVGDPGSGNLLVQGDNLLALKALLPYYHGQVKCIYIDPPYNTGNENWVYNDNVNSPMIQDWLGKVVDKEDLTRHDKWLCMMMPRLKLLLELLSEDGVIFISIDDHEYLLVYAKSKINWRPIRLKRSEDQMKYYTNPDNDPKGPWNSSTYTSNKTKEERPNLYYAITNPNTG